MMYFLTVVLLFLSRGAFSEERIAPFDKIARECRELYGRSIVRKLPEHKNITNPELIILSTNLIQECKEEKVTPYWEKWKEKKIESMEPDKKIEITLQDGLFGEKELERIKKNIPLVKDPLRLDYLKCFASTFELPKEVIQIIGKVDSNKCPENKIIKALSSLPKPKSLNPKDIDIPNSIGSFRAYTHERRKKGWHPRNLILRDSPSFKSSIKKIVYYTKSSSFLWATREETEEFGAFDKEGNWILVLHNTNNKKYAGWLHVSQLKTLRPLGMWFFGEGVSNYHIFTSNYEKIVIDLKDKNTFVKGLKDIVTSYGEKELHVEPLEVKWSEDKYWVKFTIPKKRNYHDKEKDKTYKVNQIDKEITGWLPLNDLAEPYGEGC